MAVINVRVPTQYSVPKSNPLDLSPNFFEKLLIASTRGLFAADGSDGWSELRGIKNLSMFSWDDVKDIVAAGGDVEGYPAFLEMDESKFDDPVPSFVPDHEDSEGNPVSWRSWGKANYRAYRQVGTTISLPLNKTGAELIGSVLSQLDGMTGFTVKPMSEYPAAPEE